VLDGNSEGVIVRQANEETIASSAGISTEELEADQGI
jgi:hypothetical protein